ncbi:MAG: hypothetical protein V4525_15085 [Pseudomonadota bacterium]
MNINPYEPPKSQILDIAAKDAPPLWNPSAAASWSLFFSPAFGAYLHMKNWQALGNAEKASNSKLWLYVYAAFILLMALNAIWSVSSQTFDGISRIAGFALLISWYYTSGNAQITYVKKEFGNTYPRKSWVVPILVGLGAWIAMIVVIGAIAFVTSSGSHTI